MEIRDALRSHGLDPGCIHFANSTTFLEQPELAADGVRLGILLYGVLPPEQHRSGYEAETLRPAMSLETELVQVRDLPRGSRIGYRSKQRTDRDLVIGTIPIGYHHGLNRKMLNGAHTLVHGHDAPFIGAISMNSSTIDITGIEDVKIGDSVVIVGRQGNEAISINELAEKGETIAAELMMGFGKSIPRIYGSDEEDETTTIAFEQERPGDVTIGYYQTSSELPDGVTTYEIIRFLHAHLEPFHDSEETIATAVDYAFSAHPSGRGFVLLATIGRRIVGVLVCIQMHRIAIIPENLIVYTCVDREYRTLGLGRRMVKEAIECCDGDVKLHVERSNPAVRFYRKLGFKDAYIEMRYLKTDE
jgi:GNAT superfamily N-acetyltransferase